MQIPSFYFTMLLEAMAILLLLAVVYLYLLRRDKKSLSEYVQLLKDKNKTLQRQLVEQNELANNSKLLIDTSKVIELNFEKKFSQPINQPFTHSKNLAHQLMYSLVYQSILLEISAIEADFSATKTWEQIDSKLQALIKHLTILPQKELEGLIAHQVQKNVEQIVEKRVAEKLATLHQHTAASTKQPITKARPIVEDTFSQQRKREIDRLKHEITTQFEEIWHLQNDIAQTVAKSDDEQIRQISHSMEKIVRQLKDAQLCINMMDAEIITQEDKIIGLQEQ